MINIYYHSVAYKKNPHWIRNFLTLELRFFHDQLKLLKLHNFKTFVLEDYYQAKNGNSILPSKSIGIQFDDGYLDNWVFAYPLLKKYGFKATIFVSPEFVDTQNITPRPTLFDYWNNRITLEDLNRQSSGFLNWEEMRIMEREGVFDIQSHTMTHTKYHSGKEIIGFHHANSDSVYPVCNVFPQIKPCYIDHPGFNELIPYGTPFFEEKSSIVARIHHYNDEFINDIFNTIKKKHGGHSYNFDNWYSSVKPVVQYYRSENIPIVKDIESDDDFVKRIEYEIKQSKHILEDKLQKKVAFCCWPHGENTEFSHNMALKAGYKATSCGKLKETSNNGDRYDRIGIGASRNNRALSLLKALYKIQANRSVIPWSTVNYVYDRLKGYK